MKKDIPVAILLLFGLSACKNNDYTIQFKALNEGLKQYGNNIRESNLLIYDDLSDKLHDARMAAKAGIWQPKAAYVKTVADSMMAFIEALNDKLKKEAGLADTGNSAIAGGNNQDAVKTVFEKQGYAEILYRKLIDFNEKALATLNPDEFKDNPILEADLKKAKETFRKQFPIYKEMPVADWFKNTSAPAAMAMLNKLQNDVALTVNQLSGYFKNQIGCLDCGGFETFSVIAAQNSTYLKAGQLLEITAGVGTFSWASRPKITINGKHIALDQAGVAIYKMKTPEKAGKYSVPVKIEYVKPDGSASSLIKKIEYIVEK